MPQISKYQLTQKDWEKIWQLFVTVIGNVDQGQSEQLVFGLLTSTEQVMLAKRFAVSLLLLHGNSPSLIQHRLKMSRSTVYSIKALLLEKPIYQKLLSKLFPEKIVLQKGNKPSIDTNTWIDMLFRGKHERWRFHQGYSSRGSKSVR